MDDIPRRAEREILCDTMVRLERLLREHVTPSHAAHADVGFILLGVYWGHLSHKPFTAHKLAMFLHMPWSTLTGRLDWLVTHGYIEKRGRVYCMTERVRAVPRAVDQASEIIIRAADRLRKVKEI